MIRMSRSKYSNRKTVKHGIQFDSKMESEYYDILLLRQRAGQISELTLQPEFTLLPSFKRNGRTVRGVKYKGDFMYLEDGKTVVVDVKGVETKDFIIKSKLFLSQHPDKELILVTKDGGRWSERCAG